MIQSTKFVRLDESSSLDNIGHVPRTSEGKEGCRVVTFPADDCPFDEL